MEAPSGHNGITMVLRTKSVKIAGRGPIGITLLRLSEGNATNAFHYILIYHGTRIQIHQMLIFAKVAMQKISLLMLILGCDAVFVMALGGHGTMMSKYQEDMFVLRVTEESID